MQHTIISLLTVAVLLVRAAAALAHGPSTWPVQVPVRLQIEGTMTVQTPSTGFDQSASFVATVLGDTATLTATGPFGIVVARVYIQPDSFLIVNYLQQVAIDGDPRSASISEAFPIPIQLSDVLSIVRCVPPGRAETFDIAEHRSDGALFMRKDSANVEYALIDTVQGVIKQFQRKGADGRPLLNVQYGQVKRVDETVAIPHTIRVRVKDDEHIVTLVYDNVSATIPSPAPTRIQVPRSYTRTSLR